MTWFFIFLIVLMALGGAPLFAVILGAATLGFYTSEIDLAIIPKSSNTNSHSSTSSIDLTIRLITCPIFFQDR